MKYEFVRLLFMNTASRGDYEKYHATDEEKTPEELLGVFKRKLRSRKYRELLVAKGFFRAECFSPYHNEVGNRLLSLEEEAGNLGHLIKDEEALEQCLVLFACSTSLGWSLIKNNSLIKEIFPIKSESLRDYRERIQEELKSLTDKMSSTRTGAPGALASSSQDSSDGTLSTEEAGASKRSNRIGGIRPSTEGTEVDLAEESYENFAKALRLIKLREFIRIAIADCVDEDSLETTAGKISAFADAVIAAAFHFMGLKEEQLGVIAMGKLGGNELNYSSDIDIMLMSEETVPFRAKHLYRKIHKFIALLSDLKEDGNVFEVDMQIRPEGDAGELYLPPKGYMRYYATRGSSWERQAFIKARFIVGTEKLAYAFEVLRDEVIFKSDFSSEQILIDMFRMKEKIEHDLTDSTNVTSPSEEFYQLKSNFKLGLGGIRDIEFLVQFLQLHHGKLTPALNEINTLKALKKLFNYKILSSHEAVTLTDNYRLLRKIEHRLQLLNLLAIRELPVEMKAIDYLAGLSGYHKAHKAEAFMEDYQAALRSTRELFDKIFKYTALFLTKMEKLDEALRQTPLEISSKTSSETPLETSSKTPLETTPLETPSKTSSKTSLANAGTGQNKEKVGSETEKVQLGGEAKLWRKELQKFESDYFLNFSSEQILAHLKMLNGLSEECPADGMITITSKNSGNIGNIGNNRNSGNIGNIGNNRNSGNIGNIGNNRNSGNIGNIGNNRNSGNIGNIGNNRNSGNSGSNRNNGSSGGNGIHRSHDGLSRDEPGTMGRKIVFEIAAYSMIGSFSMVAGHISTKGINILSGFVFPQVDEQTGGRASPDHFYRRSFADWKEYSAEQPHTGGEMHGNSGVSGLNAKYGHDSGGTGDSIKRHYAGQNAEQNLGHVRTGGPGGPGGAGGQGRNTDSTDSTDNTGNIGNVGGMGNVRNDSNSHSTIGSRELGSRSMGSLMRSARKKTIITIHGEFTKQSYAEAFKRDVFMEELQEYFRLNFKGEIEKVREDIYLRALPFLEKRRKQLKIKPVFISIDNDSHLFYTVLRIKSEDIFLFLYQFTVSLSERRFRIAKAEFATEGSTIDNVIYVTERNREKVAAKDRLQEIRVTLLLLNYFSSYIVFAPNPYLAFSQFSKLIHRIVDDYETAFTELLKGGALFKKLARILGTSEAIFEDFFRSEAEDITNYLSSEEVLKIAHTEDYLERLLKKILYEKRYTPALASQLAHLPQYKDSQAKQRENGLKRAREVSKNTSQRKNHLKQAKEAPGKALERKDRLKYAREVSKNTPQRKNPLKHAEEVHEKTLQSKDDFKKVKKATKIRLQRESNLEDLAKISKKDASSSIPKTAPSDTAPLTLLNRFKDDSMFAIDLRFLSGEIKDFQVFCEEISALTDVVIRHTYAILEEEQLRKFSMTEPPGSAVILGLGKWGAREMGYASDVELMFVYKIAEKWQTARDQDTARIFFEDLGKKFPLAIKSKKNGIFELDFRLRPDGETSPIAVSFGKFKHYYTFQNANVRNFERMALTRLRFLPVGGGEQALKLQRELKKVADDFIYAPTPFNDQEFVRLRNLQLQEFTRPGSTNVKFSLGGLVDIEYFIQKLIITLGRADKKLRKPHTLHAMELLYKHGHLKQDVFQTLKKAHHFYRILINSLRIVRGNAQDLEIPDPKSVEFHYLIRRLLLFNALSRRENLVKRLESETKKVRKITVPLI